VDAWIALRLDMDQQARYYIEAKEAVITEVLNPAENFRKDNIKQRENVFLFFLSF
jgi:hypothetical protein